MNKSKFFSLSFKDFVKGAVVAVLTGLLSALTPEASYKTIGFAALAAFISYLIKNLFTNSNDELLTPDKK